MQKIDVGDGADQTEVYVAPGGSGITFICEYPSTVDVESGEITVKGATASGSASQTGDLTTGFSLGLFIDSGFVTAVDATNLFIGQDAFVRLTWSVSTATAKIDFLVDECRVKDTADDSEVFIIKNNCYSNGLGFYNYNSLPSQVHVANTRKQCESKFRKRSKFKQFRSISLIRLMHYNKLRIIQLV